MSINNINYICMLTTKWLTYVINVICDKRNNGDSETYILTVYRTYTFLE